jgi:hypothetical protein
MKENLDDSIKLVKELYKSDVNNIEEVLLKLRESEISQLDSVRVFKTALGITLKEANHLVLYSKTWEDLKESNINANNIFWDIIQSTP